MKHLFVSREYPPAPYPPGGIGTYVTNIARLLAERGEEVHIVGQRWSGAPLEREAFLDGKLVVHRVGADDLPKTNGAVPRLIRERDGLKKTTFPKQWFGWLAAFHIEQLVDEEGIDVIEGQEWEAPLYYFLLRRALGLGPSRYPPCIVHLHSPTEWICRFNGPPVLPREYLTMKRMETFCIHAADALLCPSNTFARQAESHYALTPGSVTVIPLPKGTSTRVARASETWANGSILFIGRLEPRKGVIEWVQAATNVAMENPNAHFDFIGADVWDLKDSFVAKLPAALRPRFRFHGSKTARDVSGFLARAKAAVVPSRWENFPNVCIEAMAAGLPVIATRCGGMVEMIEDERTGWLAPDLAVAGMVDGLTDALQRCLAATPERLAEMGAMASEAVARICDNKRIVDDHVAFRDRVRRQETHRSLTVSALSHAFADKPIHATAFTGNAGLVVSARSCAEAELLLRSIAAQTTPATAIALVCSKPVSRKDAAWVDSLTGQSVVVLSRAASLRSAAWNAGYTAIQDRVASGFLLFLDGDDLLQPDCLALIKQTFAHRPEVGLAAAWIGREDGSLEARLCPELSHQLVRNEVGSATAFRAEAIGNAMPFRPLPKEYDIWQLSVTVLAKGWIGIAFPAMLAERRGKQEKIAWPDITAMRAIRAEFMQAASSRIAPVALELLNDYISLALAAPDGLASPSGMTQIMKLLKAGARRKISRARKKLLPSRRPTENV
jgi:glycosyltransferase involved in cell wall biosynthesis